MKLPSPKPAQDKPAPRAPQQVFPEIDRPSYIDTLKFPDDISNCALKEISRLLGQYTGLHSYAIAEQAKLDVALLRQRSEISIRRNNVSRSQFTAGKTKYQSDIQVRLDLRVEQLDRQLNELEQQHAFIKSRVDIFERYCSTLSREMTRRLGEMSRV